MIPVMILTEGRCVAMMRWMPMALANCAKRAMGISTSLPVLSLSDLQIVDYKYTNVREGICGLQSGLNLLATNFSLYSWMFLCTRCFEQVVTAIHFNTQAVEGVKLPDVLLKWALLRWVEAEARCSKLAYGNKFCTFLGSTKPALPVKGVLYSSDIKTVLMPTDFPWPVGTCNEGGGASGKIG